MDNRSTTQPIADNVITSDMSSVAFNKTPEISTKKLAGEKTSPTGIPCITIKNNSASEQAQVNVNLMIKDSFNNTESQLPQTQPVFSDLLQRLQTQLTAHYTETNFVNKCLFDTDYFSLADYFVNLHVVKADKTSEVTQSNDDKLFHKPLRARDRLAGKTETIAPSDLFQPSAYRDANSKSLPSIDTVVVSGAAGVGKTTLMNYIAYQWALFKQGEGKEGLWSGFETVIIVRCRELLPENLMPDNQHWDIEHLVYRACWKDLCLPESSARELLSKLQEKPNKCLLLLDGLDELPIPETDYWRSLLGQLFHLPFKKLVTTRPYAIGNLQQWLSHDGLAEIQGFSDEDVPTFFKKHLGATEHTNNFIKDIKQNPDLWAVVHIPINAYLLKIWWKTICQDDKPLLLSEMSVSNLYESLMVNVCRRYLAKIGELDENKLLDDEMVLEVSSIRCLLDTLGCWAFEGLRQDTAQLPISWLKGVQNSDESPTLLSVNRLKQLNVPALKALGLLKQVGHAIRAQQRYEFLHLSFQEFLAANVIAVTLREGTEEQKTHLTQVIHRYKYHPNFTLVWPSVAGLLSRYPTALDDFLSILIAGPKDWVGIVEFDLLMRCLESSLLSSTDTNALSLQQQTLLRAVKQRIKRFNERLRPWTIIGTLGTLSICPKLICFTAGTVWALLRNKTVSDYICGELAGITVAHLSQTPEFVDAVLAFLRDEQVDGDVRSRLAISAVAHLSQAPEFEDAVLALLKNETVWAPVRGKLARNAVTHLSQAPRVVDAILAFLQDKTVMYSVRVDLASSAVSHLSQTSEFVDVVLAFLRDEQVDENVRCNLAKNVVAHLSQNQKFVDAIWALLWNETVSGYIRIDLANSAVSHLSKMPEFVNAIWAFLRDEQVDRDVRGKLAKSAVLHLSPTSELVYAIWEFLRDEMVSNYVRRELAKSAAPYLLETSELVDAVWVFLRNEMVSKYVRHDLASSAVMYLSQTPEFVGAVLAFLRDKTVIAYVRCQLASSACAYLSQTPEFVDAVLAFLRDKTVIAYVRCQLASSACAYLSQTPEFVDAVLAFLRDKTVIAYVRCQLASSACAYLSQTPEFVDAVLAFLRDKTVTAYVRCQLASSACAYLSQTPECVDPVLALLRDEQVDGYVRIELAINAVVHLSQTPEFVDAILALLLSEKVDEYYRSMLANRIEPPLSRSPKFFDVVLRLLQNKRIGKGSRCCLATSIGSVLWQYPKSANAALAFLRDENVDGNIRCRLTESVGIFLHQYPKSVDAILAFLRDETVDKYVRVKLAIDVTSHFSLAPEFVTAIWAFLWDDKVAGIVRQDFPRSVAAYLSKWPNKTLEFLDSLFVKDSNGYDISYKVHIPVHLLLPLYKKTHGKGRQYIREQLLKHCVLVYEQAGTVVVAQAGQIEQLTLSQSIIQKIKRDLRPYRIDINNSVSIFSKLSLFSKSAMSFFSSQHTEKSSEQTSHGNIRRVIQ